MEDYKKYFIQCYTEEVKNVLKEYFEGFGYNCPDLDDEFFYQNYPKYLFGAKKNLEPNIIDDQIELSQVFNTQFTTEQSCDISETLDRDYDMSVFDLSFALNKYSKGL